MRDGAITATVIFGNHFAPNGAPGRTGLPIYKHFAPDGAAGCSGLPISTLSQTRES